MNDIKGIEVEMVVTSCPACRMQLEDGIKQNSMPQKVWHVVQILDWAYRQEKGR